MWPQHFLRKEKKEKTMTKKAFLNCSKFKMLKKLVPLPWANSFVCSPSATVPVTAHFYLVNNLVISSVPPRFPLTNMDTILLNPGWDIHCHLLSLVQQHYYKARDIFDCYEPGLGVVWKVNQYCAAVLLFLINYGFSFLQFWNHFVDNFQNHKTFCSSFLNLTHWLFIWNVENLSSQHWCEHT